MKVASPPEKELPASPICPTRPDPLHRLDLLDLLDLSLLPALPARSDKSNRCNRSNSPNIPTSRPPPSSTSPLPHHAPPHATPSCSQLADTRPASCSGHAPRGAPPPFPRGLEHAHNHPKNALGKNAEAPSVRALRRSRYERQTALGKNAEALSVRASEPPSDRGMRGGTSPDATLYPSADRG